MGGGKKERQWKWGRKEEEESREGRKERKEKGKERDALSEIEPKKKGKRKFGSTESKRIVADVIRIMKG